MILNLLTSQFEIKGEIKNKKIRLEMIVPEKGHVTTATLPSTVDLLNEYLPSIFNCQCFNEQNKDFVEESRNTELGHLFEHIMLEYLCIEKLDSGFQDASYEGRTNWNWEKDKEGVFYIEILAGNSTNKIIENAFGKSVNLLNKIILD